MSSKKGFGPPAPGQRSVASFFMKKPQATPTPTPTTAASTTGASATQPPNSLAAMNQFSAQKRTPQPSQFNTRPLVPNPGQFTSGSTLAAPRAPSTPSSSASLSAPIRSMSLQQQQQQQQTPQIQQTPSTNNIELQQFEYSASPAALSAFNSPPSARPASERSASMRQAQHAKLQSTAEQRSRYGLGATSSLADESAASTHMSTIGGHFAAQAQRQSFANEMDEDKTCDALAAPAPPQETPSSLRQKRMLSEAEADAITLDDDGEEQQAFQPASGVKQLAPLSSVSKRRRRIAEESDDTASLAGDSVVAALSTAQRKGAQQQQHQKSVQFDDDDMDEMMQDESTFSSLARRSSSSAKQIDFLADETHNESPMPSQSQQQQQTPSSSAAAASKFKSAPAEGLDAFSMCFDDDEEDDSSLENTNSNNKDVNAADFAETRVHLTSRASSKAFSAPEEGEHATLSAKDYDDSWMTVNRRDAQGRAKDHPDFDPRTIQIPQKYYDKFTPGEAQYWTIKKDLMDCLLLFKMGKFYEIYDQDAHWACTHLNLSYMGSQSRPHCGFPEGALEGSFLAKIKRLNKVCAIVEQVETPEQLKERLKTKKGGWRKEEKVVKRAVVRIESPGSDMAPLTDEAVYALAICETQIDVTQFRQTGQSTATPTQTTAATPTAAGSMGQPMQVDSTSSSKTSSRGSSPNRNPASVDNDQSFVRIGVVFWDSASGAIHVGEFFDGAMRSQLRTLLQRISPMQVLMPRATPLSPQTRSALRSVLSSNAECTELPDPDFPSDPMETMRTFQRHGFFVDPLNPKKLNPPAALQPMCGGGPGKVWRTEALRALGACTQHLIRCKCDEQILLQKNFAAYLPQETIGHAGFNANTPMSDCTASRKTHVTLDGQTLSNLSIVYSEESGGHQGTLLEYCDRTQTAFGKRMLKKWVQMPLAQRDAIEERQQAIEFLLKHESDVLQPLREILHELPDLERSLSRVHAFSIKSKHQAKYYDAQVECNKLRLFLRTMDGFAQTLRVPKLFKNFSTDEVGLLLARCAQHGQGMADIRSIIKSLSRFDRQQVDEALQSKGQKTSLVGLIPPIDSKDYDVAMGELTAVKDEMNLYLRSVQRSLGDASIVYKDFTTEKVIAISKATVARCERNGSLTDEYEMKKTTQKEQSFTTPKLRTLQSQYKLAQEEVRVQSEDAIRLLFVAFAKHYVTWSSIMTNLAQLDCLASLAIASQHPASESCKPVFVEPRISAPSDQPASDASAAAPSVDQPNSVLEIRGGVHPMLAAQSLANGDQYIANDILMGDKECPARFIIVTGANGGGKSALLRQTCLLVIMAQLGMRVPAKSYRATIVDQIFTRIGASDKIMQGLSTFQCELSETSHILREAKERSLIVLDELGRGTSTFDGTAIAHAVIQDLAHRARCLCLFTTHYHSLLHEFKDDPLVTPYHMVVHADPDASKHEVEFLFKFRPGASLKSHGLAVAKRAGMPQSIIDRAAKLSNLFETKMAAAHGLKDVQSGDKQSAAQPAAAAASAPVPVPDAAMKDASGAQSAAESDPIVYTEQTDAGPIHWTKSVLEQESAHCKASIRAEIEKRRQRATQPASASPASAQPDAPVAAAAGPDVAAQPASAPAPPQAEKDVVVEMQL